MFSDISMQSVNDSNLINKTFPNQSVELIFPTFDDPMTTEVFGLSEQMSFTKAFKVSDSTINGLRNLRISGSFVYDKEQLYQSDNMKKTVKFNHEFVQTNLY